MSYTVPKRVCLQLMAYPGYHSGYQFAPSDLLRGYFSAVAGADRQIDAYELQRCLTSSGISGNYQRKHKITSPGRSSSTLSPLAKFYFILFYLNFYFIYLFILLLLLLLLLLFCSFQ